MPIKKNLKAEVVHPFIEMESHYAHHTDKVNEILILHYILL